MAQYSILNHADLECILVQYNAEKIKSFKVLNGGSENTNYLIRTPNQSFVLTICEQKSMADANALAKLLEYLKEHKFATSVLIRTISGKLTTAWKGKPVLLKTYINGAIKKDLPEDLLYYLGKELARLHQIKAPENLSKTLGFGIEHFKNVSAYAPNSKFTTWLKNIQIYIENHLHPELPKVLIHSDIFYNNIIVHHSGTQATIMDFEEACYYYRVFDIGMMLIGTCNNSATLDQTKVASVLRGYQQEVSLLDIEKKALQAFTVYAAAATAFWRNQNFNYVNINPAMKNHYVEMQELADFTKNLKGGLFTG